MLKSLSQNPVAFLFAKPTIITAAPGGGELNLANYTRVRARARHDLCIVSVETSAISRAIIRRARAEYGGAGEEEAALCVLAEEIMQPASLCA